MKGLSSLGFILGMAVAVGCQPLDEMIEEVIGNGEEGKSCNKCSRFSHDDESLFCHCDKGDFLLGLYDPKEDYKIPIPIWCSERGK